MMIKSKFFCFNYKKNVIEIQNEYKEKNKRVDKLNQYISYYNCRSKSIKYWKKIFFGNEVVTILNSKILYI